MTTKPLDLAQFERNRINEILIDLRDHGDEPGLGKLLNAVADYEALLSECRRQREQIAKLREALEKIAGGNVMGDETWTPADVVLAYQEKARAALAETGGA